MEKTQKWQDKIKNNEIGRKDKNKQTRGFENVE